MMCWLFLYWLIMRRCRRLNRCHPRSKIWRFGTAWLSATIPDFNPDINHLITAIEKRLKGKNHVFPMIIGALVALAIIAALLIFVVLPGMNTPQATATVTQVAAVSTTLAPTVEPTIAPTNTLEPTIAPSEQLTCGSHRSELPADVSADLTPTVAFPTGRPLQLLYNDSSFYVYNSGYDYCPLHH